MSRRHRQNTQPRAIEARSSRKLATGHVYSPAADRFRMPTFGSTFSSLAQWVCLIAALFAGDFAVVAQDSHGSPATSVAAYRSRHFDLNTDLAPAQADNLLRRLESHLTHVEKYWGQPLKGRIEFYVADDLSRWSDRAFPNRLGRLVIARIGGATVQVNPGQGSRPVPQVAVYASARPGVARHELVHAYCQQTFGAMGPIWYKEGMAEVVNLGSQHGAGVRCPREYVDFFRTIQRHTVGQVLGSGQFTQQISRSLMGIDAGNGTDESGEATLGEWGPQEETALLNAQNSYRRAWALCHFLCRNPNYRKRFQMLGKSYLLGRPDSFARAFAPVERELQFEFSFFMDRFDIGFDVHRCRWDWRASFQTLRDDRSLSSTVRADQGYQASGVRVAQGARYQYRARGKWSTEPQGGECTADGPDGGKRGGQLIGAVLNDFNLSDEIRLGAEGTFVAPTSGRLYLRCEDEWNLLFDNRGQLYVTLNHTQ